MSGECETCGDHCLDCKCERLPSGLIKTKYSVKIKPMFICIRPEKKEDMDIESEEQKQALLKALNERFTFSKDGTMTPKSDNSFDPIILNDYMVDIGCDAPGTYVDVSGTNHPLHPIPDHVNHPNHYQGKTFEVIDIIEDYELNFNLGNAIKYILRCDKKENKMQDIEKAIWYLQREIS